jgi:hypothetical protein
MAPPRSFGQYSFDNGTVSNVGCNSFQRPLVSSQLTDFDSREPAERLDFLSWVREKWTVLECPWHVKLGLGNTEATFS